MAKRLPTIRYKGADYFKDDRLRQIREITNPHNYLSFKEIDWTKVKSPPRPSSMITSMGYRGEDQFPLHMNNRFVYLSNQLNTILNKGATTDGI